MDHYCLCRGPFGFSAWGHAEDRASVITVVSSLHSILPVKLHRTECNEKGSQVRHHRSPARTRGQSLCGLNGGSRCLSGTRQRKLWYGTAEHEGVVP